MKKHLLIGAAIAAIGTLAGVVPAHAAPPGSGWDDTPDVVIGGGSDTTYLVSQRLEALYNGTPGCAVDTGTTSATKGKCTAGQTTPTNGNFDHDIFASATPTGSGAGVNALLSTGVQYNPAINYARSSRGPSGTEASELTFWGYARDGIAVISFGTRGSVSLSKQDLIDIYTCTKTDWSQFGGPAGTIIPWDMNAASGTRSSFLVTYLGNPVLGTCVRKLESGVAPFENDVKPLLADKGPDHVAGTADDDENNYLWWISYGDWKTYPYTANGFYDGNTAGTPISSSLVTVAGTTPSDASIFASTYAIMRTLYQVTHELDADCNTVPGTDGVCNNAAATVYGTTTGKGGAVRGFTEWLCRTTNAQQQINSVTGKGYRTEIISALNAEGFQQLSTSVAGLRTAGYACSVLN